MTTQPCKICRGTGTVHCPNQLCAHWCSCTVCNGTGKVEVYEDWSLGFGEEKVRAVGRGTNKERDLLMIVVTAVVYANPPLLSQEEIRRALGLAEDVLGHGGFITPSKEIKE